MLIGAVADDITGATDLCLMLSREGLRTVQVMGVPSPGAVLPDADAVVIALKSRSIPADDAVAMSVSAVRALQGQGARQILFKYCSTFDSTDDGNIGPVAEALMEEMGVELTIACPSFPAAGRTTYQGHLFVGSQLLSDSPMKDHPLNPMHDSNLVRVLSRQTALSVGLVNIGTIRQGADAVRAAFTRQHAAGKRILIVDTLADADLRTIGAACADMKLVTGGSGIALGLAANFVQAGKVSPRPATTRMPAPAGRAVILAGSCSAATRDQIAAAQAAGLPTLPLNIAALADGCQTAAQVAEWAIRQQKTTTPVIYSSTTPEALQAIQRCMGQHESGALVEESLARVAALLRDAGFSRFLIAGGETSGAVVAALGVTMLEIGPEIDPGVPWTRSIGSPSLALALKSGNFGAPDFFLKAWGLLEVDPAHV
ncbi:four-carbon acid sugar kinase family protein [Mesorhizobium sp. WSM4976]|uniref:3-oxo-tetronate kinase n=1 Tax=Mesorhizobium sp. WSM4976 TaxID=3038549 RepID=UPI00241812A7|nr:3-oxo-tetronate kinase [Mesorhizobium sp. WSM4976]MDG4892456.1 four-carbon acid sugar kinase family protein [Mesorhizobium sp. WSM4976]